MTIEEAKEVMLNGIPKDPSEEIAFLKERIKLLEKKLGVSLLSFLDELIEEKQSIGASVIFYKDLKNQMVKFLGDGNDVSLNEITYAWLNRFILHKKQNGVGVNSISTYLNRLKSIYKEAQRRNLGIKTDNPFEGLIKQGIKKKIPDFKVIISVF